MTVRDFLNAAYTLLVGEYQRIGTDLLSAVEKVDASLGLGPDPAMVGAGAPVVTSADNDQALVELGKLMGGRKR
jgi:hypothetical protein